MPLHVWHYQLCLVYLITFCMKNIYLILLATLFGLCALPDARAQLLTTEGKDFWVAFFANDPAAAAPPGESPIRLYISSRRTTQVTVTVPRGTFSQQVTVDANQSREIQLPAGLEISGSSNRYDQGIRVVSTDTISVFALNTRRLTADATNVLPAQTLGSEYIITAYPQEAQYPSTFNVVAVENNTTVQIFPTQQIVGRPNTQPFTVALSAGEVYQAQSNGDLSGTRIIAVGANNAQDCKKFAVFSGNQRTSITCGNGRDILYQQMLPVSSWGKEFIFVNFARKNNGSVVKIVASEDNTQVRVSGLGVPQVFNLNRGQVQTLNGFPTNAATVPSRSITANKPISVTAFMTSGDCDGAYGDPSMVSLNPNEQLMKQVSFVAMAVPNSAINDYYLNVVTKLTATDRITLRNAVTGDVIPIQTQFQPVSGNPQYAFARLQSNEIQLGGTYTLASDSGFIAYVYGQGQYESIAYSVGSSVDRINLNVNFAYTEGGVNQTITNLQNLCIGAPFRARVTPNNPAYIRFDWDMGDGTLYPNTQQVSHIYNRNGNFTVKVTASTGVVGGNICGSAVQDVREINVRVGPLSRETITGLSIVCPGLTDVQYRIPNPQQPRYRWFVDGGTLVSSNRHEAVVNWGPLNARARVYAVGVNDLGCVSDTAFFEVNITQNLPVQTPTGPASVCSNELNGRRYRFDNPSPRSTYEWLVTGGTIAQQPSPNEAVINWNPTGGTQTIRLRERSHTCEVVSAPLTVFVYPNLDTAFHVLQVSAPSPLQPGPTAGLQVAVELTNRDLVKDTANLYRRTLLPSVGAWEKLETKVLGTSNQVAFDDPAAKPDERVYQYRIQAEDNCGIALTSIPHQSVRLIANANVTIQSSVLSWTRYQRWRGGVRHYEVYRRIAEGPWVKLAEVNDTSLVLQNEQDGPTQCYYIRAIEQNGSGESWSNQSCVVFERDVVVAPIITPNGDGINDFLTIRNLNFMGPTYTFIIFNRWGQKIYESYAYDQRWDGTNTSGEKLDGTFFYILSGGGKEYKGAVTILR